MGVDAKVVEEKLEEREEEEEEEVEDEEEEALDLNCKGLSTPGTAGPQPGSSVSTAGPGTIRAQ